MLNKHSRSGSLAAAGTLCLAVFFMDGCAKKVAVAKPPQAPAAVAAITQPRDTSTRPTTVAQRSTPPRPASASRTPNQATKDQIEALLKRIEDAYFDYNTANIRPDALRALQADAVTLSRIVSEYPDYKLTIQGYCDERGSSEYNVALGEERAERAKKMLVDSGVPSNQLKTVSFGKEQQVCSEHDESCWQKNRRIHITQAQA